MMKSSDHDQDPARRSPPTLLSRPPPRPPLLPPLPPPPPPGRLPCTGGAVRLARLGAEQVQRSSVGLASRSGRSGSVWGCLPSPAASPPPAPPFPHPVVPPLPRCPYFVARSPPRTPSPTACGDAAAACGARGRGSVA
ncbi:hypothetical protein GQ55_1G038100 [Panicum hallii var. hallii]|uniref:Uncharacterized protein n=1 Tax=Panicum hallii var. hallii TaxID=1504633 RepID=A0A2T7F201_9POAL|nr:hypothetical protein GQ55_1G038100 [Panicum hallii var. hallii]